MRRTSVLEQTEEDVTDSLREAVASRVGEGRFGLWFGDGVSLSVSGDRLAVGVPNAFFRDWIRGHFGDSLREAAKAVTGRSLDLDFTIKGEAPPQLGHVVEPSAPAAPDRSPAPVSIPTGKPPKPKGSSRARASRLDIDMPPVEPPVIPPPLGPTRPSRRLEEFVTGQSNKLAHAAATEMARTMGTNFNPLVIHGGVGLGKTHLLEAIGHSWRSRKPAIKVIQVTAESFTNNFLEALRQGGLARFRSLYRGGAALIVDDVHFIAAKKATQDEFLHTFNALIAEGAPIVLACDQHPRQVSRLTDELATRFMGGMVVKLEAPDLATRKAILKTKGIARGVALPDSVVSYIAENLRSSVRELEGALHSLIAHATLSGKKLDLGLAKTALRDMIRHTAKSVGLKDVEAAVCTLFGIQADELKSDSRARHVTYPRMLAMYLARRHVGAAYSEIGRFFGGRNHSTVISAEKKVTAWLKDEERIRRLDGFETTGEILAALESALSR